MGSSATSGRSKIWNANGLAMKTIPMPASADSSAARGVTRRTQAPMNEPASSITPPATHASRPTRQASSLAGPSPSAARDC
ncbi:MAG: hypothetical protein U1A27_13120 [Phycisphaerae bacterium]